jgi:hypothetical protein
MNAGMRRIHTNMPGTVATLMMQRAFNFCFVAALSPMHKNTCINGSKGRVWLHVERSLHVLRKNVLTRLYVTIAHLQLDTVSLSQSPSCAPVLNPATV